MAKQLSFHDQKVFQDYKPRIEHGGGLRSKKRKLARPFDSRRPIHLTMRASMATGRRSLLRNRKTVETLLFKFAVCFNVRIMGFANAGNHVHIIAKTKNKRDFQNFLRSFSGLVARKILAAEKGRARGRFWDELAYTKIVSWGRQLTRLRSYIFQNILESVRLKGSEPAGLSSERTKPWGRRLVPARGSYTWPVTMSREGLIALEKASWSPELGLPAFYVASASFSKA